MRLFSEESLGGTAPDFTLPATDGNIYRLSDIVGENGAVIAFICNHCPYVIAIIDRLVADAKALAQESVGFAAICSNDARAYPKDSFPKMRAFAEAHDFDFPYLHDERQEVAKSYKAVCTPDLYGVSSAGEIKYRGRLDSGRVGAVTEDMPRELVQAMRLIIETGEGPEQQFPSMGCSIKWR